MIQTFTPDDVLKAQAGELAPEEIQHLTSSIQDSPELQEFADTVEMLEKEMPKLATEPSERPLTNIMAFVKQNMKQK